MSTGEIWGLIICGFGAGLLVGFLWAGAILIPAASRPVTRPRCSSVWRSCRWTGWDLPKPYPFPGGSSTQERTCIDCGYVDRRTV